MGDLPNLSAIVARGEKDRFEFLQTDLGLCLTFVEVAKTELLLMNDREAAQKALEKAEAGYATIGRLLGRVKQPEYRSDIEGKLTHLRTVLNAAHQQVHGPSTDSLRQQMGIASEDARIVQHH